MKKELNKIGDQIDIKKAVCREFDVNDIYQYVRKAGDGMPYSWSWGFEKPIMIVKNKALRFNVNGHHHKGYVYIVLNFLDLFTVYYTDFSEKIVKINTDVYIDELIERLDVDIERVPEYVR